MSGVRDRLEFERNHAPEPSPTVRPNSQGLTNAAIPVGGPRLRAQLAEMETSPEVLTPPSRSNGGSGAFTETNAPMTLREKRERQQTLAEIEATPENSRTALQQYFIDQHNEEIAKRQKWEREKAEEQAKINRENAERAATNARMFPVRLMLDQYSATDAERKKIWDIALKHPELTTDALYARLLTLRAALSAAPDWARK